MPFFALSAGALSDWGTGKKKKKKKDPDEPELPEGLEMDYLLADNTAEDEAEPKWQYEAFDRCVSACRCRLSFVFALTML